MTLAYVAGPFRASNAWEIEQNIRRAEEPALALWRMGYAVICPHTNTRFFQGAAPDRVWLDGDLEMLRRCDLVVVTPDWRKSRGARAEVKLAVEEDIPVRILTNRGRLTAVYTRRALERPCSWRR